MKEVFNIYIEEYIGMPKKIFEESLGNYIVNSNETNCIIELSNVITKVNVGTVNALAYFDLCDRSTMTMLVIKIEHPSFFKRLKYKLNPNLKERDFVGVVNVTKEKDLIVAYVKGTIFNVM